MTTVQVEPEAQSANAGMATRRDPTNAMANKHHNDLWSTGFLDLLAELPQTIFINDFINAVPPAGAQETGSI
jgi:hypothetical protein